MNAKGKTIQDFKCSCTYPDIIVKRNQLCRSSPSVCVVWVCMLLCLLLLPTFFLLTVRVWCSVISSAAVEGLRWV